MASATVTQKPNGTTTAGGWSRTGGSTVHGVLTDASDATFMYNSTGADAVLTLPAISAVVNLAAVTQVTADARGYGNGAGSGDGSGDATGPKWRGVNPSGSLAGVVVAWTATSSATPAAETNTQLVYGATVPSKTDLNAMTILLTARVAGGFAASTVAITEADVIVAYDPQPIVGMHPGF